MPHFCSSGNDEQNTYIPKESADLTLNSSINMYTCVSLIRVFHYNVNEYLDITEIIKMP